MSAINFTFIGPSKAPLIHDSNLNLHSAGRKCNRINLELGSTLQIPVALISKKIFKQPPKATFIDKISRLFGRKYVVLKVKKGEIEGFVKVNAASLRKRFDLTKQQFRDMDRQSSTHDLTASVKTFISELNISSAEYLKRTRKEILVKFESLVEPYQIHSAKLLFLFNSNHRDDRYIPSVQSRTKGFMIRTPETSDFDRKFLAQELDKIFEELSRTQGVITLHTGLAYKFVYKTKEGVIGSFHEYGHSHNQQAYLVNQLYAAFAGKPVFNEQSEFI